MFPIPTLYLLQIRVQKILDIIAGVIVLELPSTAP